MGAYHIKMLEMLSGGVQDLLSIENPTLQLCYVLLKLWSLICIHCLHGNILHADVRADDALHTANTCQQHPGRSSLHPTHVALARNTQKEMVKISGEPGSFCACLSSSLKGGCSILAGPSCIQILASSGFQLLGSSQLQQQSSIGLLCLHHDPSLFECLLSVLKSSHGHLAHHIVNDFGALFQVRRALDVIKTVLLLHMLEQLQQPQCKSGQVSHARRRMQGCLANDMS